VHVGGVKWGQCEWGSVHGHVCSVKVTEDDDASADTYEYDSDADAAAFCGDER